MQAGGPLLVVYSECQNGETNKNRYFIDRSVCRSPMT